MINKYTVRFRVEAGFIEVSRATSSVLVFKIPYNKLSKELYVNNSFIVYILYGHDNYGKETIYVGKSKNGLYDRPTSHDDKCDNWEFCYVLTQHKESTFFNDGIIQYIENQINVQINKINRFKNTTITTSDSTINDYEKDDCEAYIEEVYNMLYVLGIDLKTICYSQPNKSKFTVDNEIKNDNRSVLDNSNKPVEANNQPIPEKSIATAYKTYYAQRTNRATGVKVKATMEIVNGKYIVKAGSVISPIISPVVTVSSVLNKRNTAKIIDNVLQNDIEFNSPSAAGSFVIGCNVNGWTEWKDATGNTLESLKR